jgi:hypothetical protein
MFEVPRARLDTHHRSPALGSARPRRLRISNRFTVYWERSTDSFQVAAEGEVFGRRGTPNVGLNNDGAVYAEAALDLTLCSPDNDLEDMPFAEGVEAGRCLVVIGDGVMFGWGPVLTAANRYRMVIMRGRRGTLRGSHAVGAEAWIVQLGQRNLTEWEGPRGWMTW